MILYPNYYFQNVTKISTEFLKEHEIKGLILDVDNTLMDIDKNLLEGVIEWHKNIRASGIKTLVLSNTNKMDKLEKVSKALNIEYISFAKKPLKSGFLKAQKKLGLDLKNIAAVGDQIFTDVIGANRCKMISILVEPVAESDLWMTKWKRPIERFILNKYLKKINK